MGRSKDLYEKSLMDIKDIPRLLFNSCEKLKNFKAYIYGSSLKGIGADIDILIVGSSGTDLFILKKELALAGRELPLDILCMEPCEEIETNFITKHNCVPFEKLL